MRSRGAAEISAAMQIEDRFVGGAAAALHPFKTCFGIWIGREFHVAWNLEILGECIPTAARVGNGEVASRRGGVEARQQLLELQPAHGFTAMISAPMFFASVIPVLIISMTIIPPV